MMQKNDRADFSFSPTGSRQLIILGSGFDTRSLRLPSLQNIRVFEVDHPDTAQAKQKTLDRILPHPPSNTTYTPIDFETQNLEKILLSAGVDFLTPTTIIWEGVSNYLQQPAIAGAFTLCGKFPSGSSLIFTYIDKKVLDDPGSYLGGPRLMHDLEKIEEKWTFGFNPQNLPDWCRNYGFALKEDQGAAQYCQQYMPERTTILEGYEFYRTALAVRTP
jgi:methyltransferase (TIGR00027 family)